MPPRCVLDVAIGELLSDDVLADRRGLSVAAR